VTDLRGETTTVLDPASLLDVDTDTLLTDGGQRRNRIVVLDGEALGTESSTGWLVSAVEEVRAVADDTLDTSAVADSDFLRGFLKRGDDFTLWLDPHELTA
jgi:chemotaxis signal transduction protein